MPNLFLLLTVACQHVEAQSSDQDPDPVVEQAEQESTAYKVTIADPFIELHTGPGAGYPIFYVVDRGTEVRILRRKTDWFRIETRDGKSGWANREQMRETLLPSGEKFKLVEVDQDDFARRQWILGVTGGEFESAPIFSIFAGYSFTPNLSGEVSLSKSIGDKSSATFYKGNLVMQPLPDWKYSPYMTLGMGQIEVDPSVILISTDDDKSNFAQFGLGLQRHISRSFLFRLEYNEYVIFSSGSSDNNEVVNEWKFGFAVFF